jgi:hypothetical protein
MNPSAERADGASPPLDPVQAVSRFFREDPARILAVASRLRAPDRAIESTVVGMSMGRTIPAGSRIQIELGERGRYERGEVVAFLAGDHIVVHRVVGRVGRGARGYLLTRGDAALVPDPPIDEACILGAVTAIRREQGWTAPGGRAEVSFPARVITSVVLVAVVGLLRLHPRAAAAFITCLHRAARPLRRGARRRPPGSAGRPLGAA